MAYPDLQSNPGAEYVLYLNFDGLDIDDITNKEKNLLLNIINDKNVDFLPITTDHNDPILGNLYPETHEEIKQLDPSHPIRTTYNKKLDYLYVPGINSSNGWDNNKGNWTTNDFTNLWRFTSYKLETFNVNVTTNKNIWQNTAVEKRFMTVITWKPNFFTVNNASFEEIDCKDNGISYYRFSAGINYYAAGITMFGDFSNINFVFDNYNPSLNLFIDIQYTPTINGKTITTKFDNAQERPGPDLIFHSVEKIAESIVHEFGHFLSNNNQPFINHDGVMNGGGYYGGHNGWAPIMGNSQNVDPASSAGPIALTNHDFNPVFYSQKVPLVQWSKGEYKNANEKQDDIQLLSERYGWVKAPIKLKNLKNKQSFPVPKKMRHIIKSDMAEQTDPVYIFSDYYEKENKIEYPGFKKTIKGMIGYSYDFDILKILLKAGEYQIKLITPNSSPYYGGLEIVNFKEQNIQLASDGDYGGIYPTNISSDNFESILYNEDTTTSKIKSFTEETYNYRIHTATIRLSWSTIIYLKVFGDKKPDPLDTEKGFSEYGSIGKYFIEISNIIDYIRLQDLGETNILNTYLTPHAIPENYVVCKDGSEYEVTFFTEKTYNPGGYEDPNGPHFLTMPVYWNNSVINKQFLVYGQPIDIDAEEEGGKFYLNVLINGTPKKQEFILGFNADSPIYY